MKTEKDTRAGLSHLHNNTILALKDKRMQNCYCLLFLKFGLEMLGLKLMTS